MLLEAAEVIGSVSWTPLLLPMPLVPVTPLYDERLPPSPMLKPGQQEKQSQLG